MHVARSVLTTRAHGRGSMKAIVRRARGCDTRARHRSTAELDSKKKLSIARISAKM
jgi:hypothetical protein